ncbi:insecticidal toxin complex protein TccC [Photorhabdus sp. RM323S]|uniref:insecticidal toxin complex protein TccC n=1 Tax=Photorhabdus sp. RM323S TaxID=3342828 RepID=UPI0036DC0F83
MSTSDITLYTQTPTVSVLDNRGLSVRDIGFHRTVVSGDTDTRITRHQYDNRGHLNHSIDPRLYDAKQTNDAVKPNFIWQHDLAGNALRTESVDAGRIISLNDVEGRLVMTVNATGVHQTRFYEGNTLPGRLLSVSERVSDEETPDVTERFIWAENTTAEKDYNLSGQCIRHYDTAGVTRLESQSLAGTILSQSHQLLAEEQKANWMGDDETVWQSMLASEVYTTQSTTNAIGTLLTQTDAKGNIQRLAYDIAGQLKGSWLTVKGQNEQIIVKSLTWSAAGHKLREEHGNGVITQYSYEPETQRLIGITTRRADNRESTAKVLQDLRYEYDPVGNVISIHNDAEATRFWRNQTVVPENRYVYDSLYQLISATGREMANIGQQSSKLPSPAMPVPADDSTYTNYLRTYTYDRGGNLVQIRHSSPATQNNYTTDMTVSSRSNRAVLSTLTTDPTQVDVLFDSGGHQKTLMLGQNLNWNIRGELQQVTPVSREDASDREWYRYGSDGMRLLKVSEQQTGNSTQVQRVTYLPGLELRTTQVADKTTKSLQMITVGEAGRAQVRVLHWENGKPEDINNNQVRYSYDNLLGSSQLELDSEGQILSQEEYYPYGSTAVWAAKNQTEASYKFIRYSGKERDATGLYYYGYRYYQPWVGRWLNADPAGTVDGLNLYRMVRNNPITLIDHDGLAPSPNRNRNTFWFASFLFRKPDEGMSASMRRGQKIGRAIAGGIAIGGLAATIAGTAGAAIPVILGVAAIGAGIGALMGYNVGSLLEKGGALLARLVQGKSTLVQSAAGAAAGAGSAAAYGARAQGVGVASAAGAATGAIGSLINNADRGIGGAIGAGSAVGTIDTILGTSSTLTHEISAAAGGAAGGMITGTQGSTRAGIHAGIGTYYGSWVGFGLDVASNPAGHLANYAVGYAAGLGAEMAINRITGGGFLGRILGRVISPYVAGLARQLVHFSVARPVFEPIFSLIGGLVGGIGTGLHRTMGRDSWISRGLSAIGSGIDNVAGMIGNQIRGRVLTTTGIANAIDYGTSAVGAARRAISL